jgi:hypothetical protein
MFRDSDFVASPFIGKDAPPAVSVLSSISNDTGTARMFSGYAEYIHNTLRRGGVDVGLETDELRELENDLWTMHDSYPVNNDEID